MLAAQQKNSKYSKITRRVTSFFQVRRNTWREKYFNNMFSLEAASHCEKLILRIATGFSILDNSVKPLRGGIHCRLLKKFLVLLNMVWYALAALGPPIILV